MIVLVAALVLPGGEAVASRETGAEKPTGRQLIYQACIPLEKERALQEEKGEKFADKAAQAMCTIVSGACTTKFSENEEPCRRDLARFEKALRETGRSLVSEASYFGLTDLLETLIQAGIDVNVHGGGADASDFGRSWSPLMLAAAEGHGEAVSMLVAARADLDASNELGRTALMFAAKYGYEPIVRELLEHGASPDIVARDETGWTALIGAAYEGSLGTVKLLLEHGADPAIRDKSGKTALMWAEEQGHARVARALKKAGAD